MKIITFELTKTIKCAGGDRGEIEISHIDLLEPTGKVSHLCCQIEALIQSGIIAMSDFLDKSVIEQAAESAKDAKNGDDSDGPDAESVLQIMSSGGIDMEKVVIHFRELFRTVALMGGEKPLTIPRMDDMSHKDFRKMMGEYAANFILT